MCSICGYKTKKMIARKSYIEKIAPFVDKPFIKILTGLRRSGKSFLLALLRKHLQERGIDEDQIIDINFESLQYIELKKAENLYAHIAKRINKGRRTYIFLDEIQEVEHWERVVNSLRVDFDTDIFLTGSNARMLSSELATALAGRYVQFEVFTLSFAEFLEFRRHYLQQEFSDMSGAFALYMETGGFPVLHTEDFEPEQITRIIYDIYTSVLLRDVVQRYKIRNIELLERLIKFIFDNTGNVFSAKKIADYFKSQQRRFDINTIYNYITAFESSYILHKTPRFRIRGKEILKTQEKFYTGDVGLINGLLGKNPALAGGLLENIVMLELKRRGYKVFVGKIRDFEVDFIGQKNRKQIYVQVAYKLTERETLERELRPLRIIPDDYPKYILTTDTPWNGDIEGIHICRVTDFLLNKC